jgi:hypothetical protein
MFQKYLFFENASMELEQANLIAKKRKNHSLNGKA